MYESKYVSSPLSSQYTYMQTIDANGKFVNLNRETSGVETTWEIWE
jgi:hypothetical protein